MSKHVNIKGKISHGSRRNSKGLWKGKPVTQK
jgi:hypothetical protein